MRVLQQPVRGLTTGLLALALVTVAACSDSEPEVETTSTTTTTAPTTTTTTEPTPADAHVLDGRYFTVYRVAERDRSADVLADADVGDIEAARIWELTSNCPVGPCDAALVATNPDVPAGEPFEGSVLYQNGVYTRDLTLEGVGSCVLPDETLFDGAFDERISFTFAPTLFDMRDGVWVATQLEGTRFLEGSPTEAAAAAGCTSAYADTYEVVSIILAEGEGPSALPSGSDPVGDALAVGVEGEIVKINPDGTGEVSITTGDSPTWSPSRTFIAFDRDGRLYVANADGSEERELTNGRRPRWSPDGSQLAFVRNSTPNADIMAISLTSGAIQRITSDGWARSAEWIDSSTLAIQEFRGDLGVDDGWLYWLWPLSGAIAEDALIGQGITSLSAAADGGQIVAVDLATGDLIVASPDGSDPVVLVPGTGDILAVPVWSPEGDRIIWYNGGELWLVELDGGEPQLVGYPLATEPALAWSR